MDKNQKITELLDKSDTFNKDKRLNLDNFDNINKKIKKEANRIKTEKNKINRYESLKDYYKTSPIKKFDKSENKEKKMNINKIQSFFDIIDEGLEEEKEESFFQNDIFIKGNENILIKENSFSILNLNSNRKSNILNKFKEKKNEFDFNTDLSITKTLTIISNENLNNLINIVENNKLDWMDIISTYIFKSKNTKFFWTDFYIKLIHNLRFNLLKEERNVLYIKNLTYIMHFTHNEKLILDLIDDMLLKDNKINFENFLNKNKQLRFKTYVIIKSKYWDILMKKLDNNNIFYFKYEKDKYKISNNHYLKNIIILNGLNINKLLNLILEELIQGKTDYSFVSNFEFIYSIKSKPIIKCFKVDENLFDFQKSIEIKNIENFNLFDYKKLMKTLKFDNNNYNEEKKYKLNINGYLFQENLSKFITWVNHSVFPEKPIYNMNFLKYELKLNSN